MNNKSENELLEIIKTGESKTVEFKTSFQKEVIESVVALANTKGGNILIGVKDSGEIIGITLNDESLQNYINIIRQNTEPKIIVDVELHTVNEKGVLNIEVDEYPIKPVSYKGRYYKRRTNSNHQMSATEISDAHMKTVNSSWDYFIDPYHGLDDIDEQNIKKFMKMSNIDDDIATIYSKFELVRDSKITFGCYLLFNNNEHALLTGIEIGRFQTETIIKDSLSIHGGLINQVDTVIEFIYKHINKAYVITGKPQRDEVWDYPMDAIREIVVNMIVHRDYRSSGHTTVKIFDDKIEFFNQGKLPKELSIEKMKSGKYRSIPRNLQIADVFKSANIIEKYGSGVKRVISIFKDCNLREPLFETTMGGILVTVYKETTQEMIRKGSTKEKIIKAIKENQSITREELAIITNVSANAIKQHLANLKNNGILKRTGSTKSGHWEVVK